MWKIIKLMFSRVAIIGVILLIQVLWLVVLFFNLSEYTIILNRIFQVISIIVVIWLINKRDNPAYKLAWIIPILLFPTLGGPMYLMFGNKKPSKGLRDQLDDSNELTSALLVQEQSVIEEIEKMDKHIAGQTKYISSTVGFPVYKNSIIKYYESGENNFAYYMEELKKAKHFIFMEYFIINENSYMWDTVLHILKEKVKEGVEVRLIYDDVGCITLLPYKYYEKLQKEGIKCVSFNHFKPFLSIAMNNRDHRKITVIDGHTAFTGGWNFADEYINLIDRFGYWKDTGAMIKGEAAWNFTVMFLQMWNLIEKTDIQYDYYKPRVHHTDEFESYGYVQPFGDSPLDEEIAAENVYLNIINRANDYVYIFTPYLIIDNEMITALCLATKRGVDVVIITPGTPDKKLTFLLTQSYYSQLVDAGVRIYQYSPGFIHAKNIVCDDEVGVVGTINFDYRSLYLHFECGVWMYKTHSIMEMKEDALRTIGLSHLVTKEECKKNWFLSMLQSILRVFAPLM